MDANPGRAAFRAAPGPALRAAPQSALRPASRATPRPAWRAASPALLAAAALAAVLAAALGGCGLRRQAPIAFASSDYSLFGRVTADGRGASGQLVKLYNQDESLLLDSLRAEDSGEYGFRVAPAGPVMVKVSSADPRDFGYVRYLLTRGSMSERDSVPPMDLRAFGCAAASPPAAAQLPAPTPDSSIAFSWTPMSVAGTIKYRVRLADELDSLVWESTREKGTSAVFNGIGTSGAYAGRVIPPGRYRWRVKVKFPSNVTAATHEQEVLFRAAGTSQPRGLRAARTARRP